MFKAYNEEKENDKRFELNKMRLQTMILVNQNIKPVNQFRDPTKFLKFYWEIDENVEIEIWNNEKWNKIDKKLGLKK